jgi:hypothetical protein
MSATPGSDRPSAHRAMQQATRSGVASAAMPASSAVISWGFRIDTALEFRQPCVSFLRRDMQAGLPIDLPSCDRLLAQLLPGLLAVGKLPNGLEHHPMRSSVPRLRETFDALSRLRIDLQRGRRSSVVFMAFPLRAMITARRRGCSGRSPGAGRCLLRAVQPGDSARRR